LTTADDALGAKVVRVVGKFEGPGVGMELTGGDKGVTVEGELLGKIEKSEGESLGVEAGVIVGRTEG
jgi:hypothetical protein